MIVSFLDFIFAIVYYTRIRHTCVCRMYKSCTLCTFFETFNTSRWGCPRIFLFPSRALHLWVELHSFEADVCNNNVFVLFCHSTLHHSEKSFLQLYISLLNTYPTNVPQSRTFKYVSNSSDLIDAILQNALTPRALGENY